MPNCRFGRRTRFSTGLLRSSSGSRRFDRPPPGALGRDLQSYSAATMPEESAGTDQRPFFASLGDETRVPAARHRAAGQILPMRQRTEGPKRRRASIEEMDTRFGVFSLDVSLYLLFSSSRVIGSVGCFSMRFGLSVKIKLLAWRCDDTVVWISPVLPKILMGPKLRCTKQPLSPSATFPFGGRSDIVRQSGRRTRISSSLLNSEIFDTSHGSPVFHVAFWSCYP